MPGIELLGQLKNLDKWLALSIEGVCFAVSVALVVTSEPEILSADVTLGTNLETLGTLGKQSKCLPSVSFTPSVRLDRHGAVEIRSLASRNCFAALCRFNTCDKWTTPSEL